jgi:hypothetical protein
MARFAKSEAELLEAFRIQLVMLRASAVAYDEGLEWESIRIATHIYTLIHVSQTSRPVLEAVGLRHSLRIVSMFRDLNPPVRDGLIAVPPTSLAAYRIADGGITFMPVRGHGILPEHWQSLSVDDWYNERVIDDLYPAAPLTRKEIVNTIRSQDGGAHLDGDISLETYRDLTTNGDRALRLLLPDLVAHFGVGNIQAPKNLFAAMVRQFAWELNMSFKAAGY